MKDNDKLSNLRKKLESGRGSGEKSSIESRLYGPPDEERRGQEDDPGQKEEKPKVEDFTSLKKEADEKTASKEEGPRILADYTQEQHEHPDDEHSSESLIEKPSEKETKTPVDSDVPKEAEALEKPKKKRKKKKPKRYTKLTALKENIMSIPKYILVSAALFLILFSVLLWYVFTGASDLETISISGNEIISEEEIKSRLDFQTGDKMYSISTSTAEENIALLPIIVEVTVERDWWQGVNVAIEEHQAVGYIENEGSYNPLLENARILRGYQVTPANAPLIHYFEGEEMDQLVDNLNDIEPEILGAISEIYFRPSENSRARIHILMNDGQEIVADYRDFGEKMNHYIGMKDEIGAGAEGIIDIEIGSSFLPYNSVEARQIKEGIYNSPEMSGYVDEISTSMNSVKEALNEFENGEDE